MTESAAILENPIEVDYPTKPATEQQLETFFKTIQVRKALEIFKLNSDEFINYDLKYILLLFLNYITKGIGHFEENRLISAKNILVRNHIEDQLKENGNFGIKEFLPVKSKYVCSNCKGTGEKYNFLWNPSHVTCRDCNGTGNIPCKKCNGTGKIIDVEQLKVYDCKQCKDNNPPGNEKCGTCRGTGKYRGWTLSKIRKSKLCKNCKGIGFEIPK